MSSAREYEIILLGATGYTGKLTARHLSQSRDVTRWAIAGRNVAALQTIADDLAINGGSRPAVLSLNLADQAQLDALVSRSKVVIASVGPYALHGEPIIASCIRSKTHYTDVTGESVWISAMIDKYEADASKAGVKLIPFSGFDSIPSDLSTLYSATHFLKKFNQPATHVQNFFHSKGGGVSGGTLHTVVNLIDDKALLKKSMEKYHLNPRPEREQKEANPSPRESEQLFPRYSKEVKKWSVPFPMAGVNTRVVRRSAALYNKTTNSVFAPSFSYNEAMIVPNFFASLVVTVVLGIALVLLQFGFIRSIVKRVFPQGSGPKSNEGSFTVKSVATNNEGQTLVTRLTGPEAYFATGIFVGEVAILLSKEFRSELQGKAGEAGFLTPATFGGLRLVESLEKRGMKFEVESK